VRAPDRLDACLRHPEVPHLAFGDQVVHRARDVFDRDVGVDAVLVAEIERFDAEPLE
jgi:hypothetical protein